MKKQAVVVAIGMLGVSMAFAAPKHARMPLKNDTQRVSYILGLQAGQSFKKVGVKLDQRAFIKGMNTGTTGTKPLLTVQQMQTVMMRFKTALAIKLKAKVATLAARNLAKGTAFLAANAKKSGIKTLSSGIQYKVIKKGTGMMPKATDKVTVDYEGSTINGIVFDSSYKRGTPATFPLNGVIKGWTDALSHMKKGATWMIYIPAALAYGANGQPPVIGPNEALVFKVHLIKINSK